MPVWRQSDGSETPSVSYRKEKGVKHRHMPHASSHVFNPQDGIEEKSYVHEEYVKSVKEEENQVRHTTAWTRPFSLLGLCFLTPMPRCCRSSRWA